MDNAGRTASGREQIINETLEKAAALANDGSPPPAPRSASGGRKKGTGAKAIGGPVASSRRAAFYTWVNAQDFTSVFATAPGLDTRGPLAAQMLDAGVKQFLQGDGSLSARLWTVFERIAKFDE